MPKRMYSIDRWRSKVQFGAVDECWEWTGSRLPKGYGKLGVQLPDGRWNCVLAHRFAWEAFVGPIPDGLCVCHRCDNPPCQNWMQHLFLGTLSDNNADMRAKNRDHRGPRPHTWKTHCRHGHPLSGDNIYVKPNGKRECRACMHLRSVAQAAKQKAERHRRRYGT